jgi:repressor LexA
VEKLTKKQERIFSFIRAHLERFGYPPTLREIVSHVKLSGPHHAKKFLDILERKGYIERLAKSSRAIKLLNRPPSRSIPIVGKVRAGVPLLAVENIEGFLALDQKVARFENSFLLRVEGDSMIDAQIKDGDLALVKAQSTAENGEIVVALLGEEATVKKFFKDSDSIRLEPANPRVKPMVIKKGEGEVTILGKVVAIVRDLEGKTRKG